MDLKIKNIISKSAGIYFIVTDNSQVATIEADPKLRLFPISVEQGGVNALYLFAKGDISGFQAIFGKSSRAQEKKGNFSYQTCVDALKAGPIAVINLRAFNDLDIVGGFSVSPNGTLTHQTDNIRYDSLFTTNSFWVPNKGKLVQAIIGSENDVLQFGNIGNTSLATFVTKSNNYSTLTDEGDLKFTESKVVVDEFPAIDFDNTYVKDTFIDVWVFANNFNPSTVSTNPFYGHLFDNNGNIPFNKLTELSQIKESGFIRTFTGSIIPGIKNELGTEIAIDNIINATYMSVGLLCNINEDVFELTYGGNNPFIDLEGVSLYDIDGEHIPSKSKYIYSHVGPDELTKKTLNFPPLTPEDFVTTGENLVEILGQPVNDHQFIAAFEQGLRIGDKLEGEEGVPAVIESIELLDPVTTANGLDYTPALYTVKGNLIPSIPVPPDEPKTIQVNIKKDTELIYSTPITVSSGSIIKFPLLNALNGVEFDTENIFYNESKLDLIGDFFTTPVIDADSTLELNLVAFDGPQGNKPARPAGSYKSIKFNGLLNYDIKDIESFITYEFYIKKSQYFIFNVPEITNLSIENIEINGEPAEFVQEKELSIDTSVDTIITADVIKEVPLFDINLSLKIIDNVLGTYTVKVEKGTDIHIALFDNKILDFDTASIKINEQTYEYVPDSNLISILDVKQTTTVVINAILYEGEPLVFPTVKPEGTNTIELIPEFKGYTLVDYKFYVSEGKWIKLTFPTQDKATLDPNSIEVNGVSEQLDEDWLALKADTTLVVTEKLLPVELKNTKK